MTTPGATGPLTRGERRGLILAGIALVVFGTVVELRTAFLQRRMGDLGVFLRAAWAVRTGGDLYAVTDNTWHYAYPPLFALVLTPLADPPPGADRAGMLPAAVSAGIWFILNVLLLFWAAHQLASAVEQTSTDTEIRGQPRGCRRWWALRTLPVLVCLPPVGHTLMRGQVNVLLLALLCALTAALLRGHRLRAGLWLAGAICLKVIPAYLLLVPLWRRDGRCLVGCILGLFLGLAVIPTMALGPTRTAEAYRRLNEILVLPALGLGTDRTLALELTTITHTDSQSLVATLHNTLHLDRATRPEDASPLVRRTGMLLGGLMTLLTLWVGPRRDDSTSIVVFVGALTVTMLLICPICHLHYFCLSMPLATGLLAASHEGRADLRLGPGLLTMLGVHFLANTLPHFPGLEILRDVGLAMYGALVLWMGGIVFLWRRGRRTAMVLARTALVRRAA